MTGEIGQDQKLAYDAAIRTENGLSFLRENAMEQYLEWYARYLLASTDSYTLDSIYDPIEHRREYVSARFSQFSWPEPDFVIGKRIAAKDILEIRRRSVDVKYYPQNLIAVRGKRPTDSFLIRHLSEIAYCLQVGWLCGPTLSETLSSNAYKATWEFTEAAHQESEKIEAHWEPLKLPYGVLIPQNSSCEIGNVVPTYCGVKLRWEKHPLVDWERWVPVEEAEPATAYD